MDIKGTNLKGINVTDEYAYKIPVFYGLTNVGATTYAAYTSTLLTTSTSKWGGSSMQLTSGATYAITNKGITFDFPTTFTVPLTIEGWFMEPTAYGQHSVSFPNYVTSPFVSIATDSTATASLIMLDTYLYDAVGNGAYSIFYSYRSNSGTSTGGLDPTGTTYRGTWAHLAVTFHNGTEYSVWINGWRSGSAKKTTVGISSLTGEVFRTMALNGHTSGAGNSSYIDDIRISNVDRYGDVNSITVPTGPYTPDANTMALIRF